MVREIVQCIAIGLVGLIVHCTFAEMSDAGDKKLQNSPSPAQCRPISVFSDVITRLRSHLPARRRFLYYHPALGIDLNCRF